MVRKQIEEEDRVARELEREVMEKTKSRRPSSGTERYRDSPGVTLSTSNSGTAPSQANDDPVDDRLPLIEDGSVRSNESVPLAALRQDVNGSDPAQGFRWSVQ